MDELLGVSMIHEFFARLFHFIRLGIHPAPHFLSVTGWTCSAADHNKPFSFKVIDCADKPVISSDFLSGEDRPLCSKAKRWLFQYPTIVTVPQIFLDLAQ